jgi:hypothetical protein
MGGAFCQSVQHKPPRLKVRERTGAAPRRRPRETAYGAERQPVKRGAAWRRGFAALQTLNDLWLVVTLPFESVAVIVRR